LALEVGALQGQLPVVGKSLREFRNNVVVLGPRLNLVPGVGVRTLPGRVFVRIAPGHEAGDGARVGIDDVTGSRPRERAGYIVRHPERHVVSACGREITLRKEAAAIHEPNLLLVAELAGNVEVVSVVDQVPDAPGGGRVFGRGRLRDWKCRRRQSLSVPGRTSSE